MKRDFNEFKQFIIHKKIAVLGIGVSNIPLIKFLVNLGAQVSAFDKKNEEQLGSVVHEFNELGVGLVLGEGYMDKLSGFDVIFKTPSMRIDLPALVRAKESGTIITSEMEEFVKYCPAKIYGITGSDGKTTTTTLVYKMLLEEGYKTWVGGNIGTPLFSRIEDINSEDRVVIELSSFQLMTMTVSPEIAVVTNLSPNHLDIHKGMEEYISAKKNIFKYQGEADITVFNFDNAITNSMAEETKAMVRYFSIKENKKMAAYYQDEELKIENNVVCKKNEVKLIGMHNVENLLAAFAAVKDEVSIKAMREVATNFTGVEHRCEFVKEINGVSYYNDSIASSPTRTLAGLKAYDKPVILLAGGYDKKIPFDVLAEEGHSKIKTLILMGATKHKIKASFEKLKEEKGIVVNLIMADSLIDAVNKAKEIAVEGDIITLSPACASFDSYPNFEIRGNEYKKIVNSI